jgi:hypothetical protein
MARKIHGNVKQCLLGAVIEAKVSRLNDGIGLKGMDILSPLSLWERVRVRAIGLRRG